MEAKKFALAPALALALLSAGCDMEVGMGEAVDLEAPKISITSPDFGAFLKKKVAFGGKASDNVKVTRVIMEEKIGDSWKFLKDAAMEGDGKSRAWSAEIDFETEGAKILRFSASDDVGNTSASSSKQILFFVDEQAPEGDGWKINRGNNITYPLKSKESLEALSITSFDSIALDNIDAVQNESFKITGKMTDTMGVKSVTLKICADEEGAEEILSLGNEAANAYFPEFSVTHEALAAADSKYAASDGGKPHLLYVFYEAEDVVTSPAPNKTDSPVPFGCFLWMPESDFPHILAEGESAGGAIVCNVQDSLPVKIFDDDALGEASVALLTQSEYSAVKNSVDFSNPSSADFQKIFDATADVDRKKRIDLSSDSAGRRDDTVALKSPATAQAMHLVAVVSDKKSGAAGKISARDVNAQVRDESAPTLIISSPENNEIPALAMGAGGTKAEFTIEGQTLDKKNCAYLEFVYVPDSVAADDAQKEEMARSWLDSLSSNSAHSALAPTGGAAAKKSAKDGMTLWSAALGAGTAKGNYVTQNFSFSLDLFSDFGGEKRSDKFFVARLSRDDGNSTTQIHRLSGDSLPPEIKINKPADMAIIDVNAQDLDVEFFARKPSGLGIKTSAYKIAKVDAKTGAETEVAGRFDSASGVYSAKIPQAEIFGWAANNEKSPKFKLYAEDLLGNKGVAQFSVVLSALPALQTVSSDTSGTQKIGDKIKIKARFSSAVGVSGVPRLKLKFSSADAQVKYTDSDALSIEGQGTNTLVFTYTVKPGDLSQKLLCFDETGSGPFDTTDGRVTQASGAEGVHAESVPAGCNLQDKKTIKIDGVAPALKDVTVTSSDGNLAGGVLWLKEGSDLTAGVALQVDEKLTVEGSPVLRLKAGAKEISLAFERAGATGLIFSKKIDKADGCGAKDGVEVSLDSGSCIALGTDGKITDGAGNALLMGSGADDIKFGAGVSKIKIDTEAPDAPAIVLPANLIYDSAEKIYRAKDDTQFSVTTEAGATARVTVNGAAAALTSGACNLTADGAHKISATQTDLALNESPLAEKTVEIAKGFPSFSVVAVTSDGNYKEGSEIKFKVSFSRRVTLDGAAAIALSGATAGDTVTSGAKAALDAGQTAASSSATFTYIVQAADEFDLRIARDAIALGSTADDYGNTQNSAALAADYIRANLHLDGVPPKILTMTPGGAQGGSASVKSFTQGNKITLAFSEKVNRGSGKITLKQTEGWPVPAVMSVDDFNTVYNQLGAAGKAALKATEADGGDMVDNETGSSLSGSELQKILAYHGTGRPVGPYMKLTHGLALSGGEYIPDIATKYVLAFQFDSADTSGAKIPYGKTARNGALVAPSMSVSVNDIRAAFESAGFARREIDVTSSDVVFSADGKTVAIAMPKALTAHGLSSADHAAGKLPEGREWEVFVDDGAFIDNTGNAYQSDKTGAGAQAKDLAVEVGSRGSGIRAFYSAKTAAPVVRVDRYSYTAYGEQCDASGNMAAVPVTDLGDDAYGDWRGRRPSAAPSGRVRVKIDCETPGAEISFKTSAQTSGALTMERQDTSGLPSGADQGYFSALGDFSQASIEGAVSGGSAYAGAFAAGDGRYDTAQKISVVAQARKTGLDDSSNGAEGIYKTVVCYAAPIYNRYDWNNPYTPDFWLMHGIGAKDGTSQQSPAGFPLNKKEAAYDTAFAKQSYFANGAFWWASYEVVADALVWGVNPGYTSNRNGYYFNVNRCLTTPADNDFRYGQMNKYVNASTGSAPQTRQ